MSMLDNDKRWEHLYKLTGRSSTMASPNFVPGDMTAQLLHEMIRVLVVGAGGLGCEILKDLALSGFGNIDVIDLDRIDVSNLNRQFLFRQKDVGKPKAEVAADFIMARVPGVTVTPHFCKIEDKDRDFYEQFHIVVLGLDSIEARRWMNSMIHSFVQYDDEGKVVPGTSKPIVDGGTEGLKGHARVILPGESADFEDTLGYFPPQTGFPLCTLADTPRNAAHCIMWAKLLAWPTEKDCGEPDMDNVEHVKWLFEKALQHATEFHIEGVTYSMTLGVAKNIIPAVASTNAIVSAMCVLEALKLVTGCSKLLDNYCMYNGVESIYVSTQKVQMLDWTITRIKPMQLSVSGSVTLEQFREQLKDDPSLRLKSPSIKIDGKTVYVPWPPVLEEACRPALKQKLSELFKPGDLLYIIDPQIPNPFTIALSLT